VVRYKFYCKSTPSDSRYASDLGTLLLDAPPLYVCNRPACQESYPENYILCCAALPIPEAMFGPTRTPGNGLKRARSTDLPGPQSVEKFAVFRQPLTTEIITDISAKQGLGRVIYFGEFMISRFIAGRTWAFDSDQSSR
jgi:hypothetical protein